MPSTREEPERPAPASFLYAAHETGHGSDEPSVLPSFAVDGVLDIVPGQRPVPITVWQVTDGTPPLDRHQHGPHRWPEGLTGRTAQLLIGLYTRVGDTVVSLGDDPALAGAAGAAGCRYLPVAAPHRLADLDHVAGDVQLLILPWPPATPALAGRPRGADLPVAANPPVTAAAMTDLFTACRVLLSPDGYTIIAVSPATTDLHELWQLIPAAHTAGLGWAEQVIAISAPIRTAELMVNAAPADRPVLRLAEALTLHVELYVFVIRGGSRG